MLKNIIIDRAARTPEDRAAFRWNWQITLPSGEQDIISAEYDEVFGGIVVEQNCELVACYEGSRRAMIISKIAKQAIAELYS